MDEGPADRDLRVVFLLGCAAVLAAVTGAYAAIVGDRGSDLWHQAIREDIRKGARIVTDARQLFEEEAPTAHRVAQYALLSRALAAEADAAEGSIAEILRAEAEAQEATATVLSQSSRLTGKDPSHAIQLSGAEVLRRYAEIRSRVPDELAQLDPDAVQARGEDDQLESSLLIATTLASAFALLLGALAEALPPLRRRLVTAGFAVLVVGAGAALVTVA